MNEITDLFEHLVRNGGRIVLTYNLIDREAVAGYEYGKGLDTQSAYGTGKTPSEALAELTEGL